MDSFFKDKRVLVTGAGKGIGRDIAVTLYKHGAKTVALSRTAADLELLEKECPGMQTVHQDLADWASTRETVSKLGHFDLLVNNAGVLINAPFLEYPKEDFDKIFDVNIKAVINVSQVVAGAMVQEGKGGAIVNMSSVASKVVSVPGLAGYAATKGALDSLTQAMALELGPHKIRVNSVNPGATITDMYQKCQDTMEDVNNLVLSRCSVGRLAVVADVTNAVLFLLSDRAAMVTGTTLMVDGGYTQH